MSHPKLLIKCLFLFIGTLVFCLGVFPAEVYAMPNVLLNILSPPATEQNNSAISFSSANAADVYAAWTEYPPGYVFPSLGSVVGWRWSFNGGAAWPVPGSITPTPLGSSEWNPAIGDLDITFAPLGFVLLDVSFGPPAGWFPVAANQINAYQGSFGGLGFTYWTTLATNSPGTWLDYPNIAVDDFLGPCTGTQHAAWVEYIDGSFTDANGNGNFFDDVGDFFQIRYAVSPPPWVPFIPVGGVVVPGSFAAVFPNEVSACRPSLAVMPPAFGNLNVSPGGAYIAWTDGANVWISFNSVCLPVVPSPPALVWSTSPSPLVPPILAPGINAASNATVGIGQSPNCPGWVFVAWAQQNGPDVDVFFRRSPDGTTWTLAPVMVNQVKRGDQWEPKMFVTPNTGVIKIVYLDRRDDPTNTRIATWVSTSYDCGNTWTDCALSAQAPPVSTFGIAPAPAYIGDYIGSDVIDMGLYGFTWNDGRNGVDQDVFFENRCCDCHPGDANGDNTIDISDAVYLIGYIFGGGAPPTPYPLCSGDANCDCTVDISDAVYLIAYIFAGGPAPCDCFTWVSNCGPLVK